MKQLLATTAVVCAALWFHPPTAHAAPLVLGTIIDVTSYGTPDNAAFYAATTDGYNYYTGPVTLNFAGGSVEVFCADLNHTLHTGLYQVGLLTQQGTGQIMPQALSNLLAHIAAIGLAGDDYVGVAAQALIWDREYNIGTVFADLLGTAATDYNSIGVTLASLLNDGTYGVALIPYGQGWSDDPTASQQMIVGQFAAPEPASIALLGFGLLGTVAAARRRRA